MILATLPSERYQEQLTTKNTKITKKQLARELLITLFVFYS